MLIFVAIGFLMFLLLSFSVMQLPLYLALFLGFLPFVVLARMSGTKTRVLFSAISASLAQLSRVYQILFLIGAAIGLWMASGTLPYLINLGIGLIHPNAFLLLVFLLTWAMTFLLGSALGSAGMIGVLFMAIAHASGYSLPMTAGAVVSAIYLGERSSPLSSCANLVAEVTQRPLMHYLTANIKNSLPSIGLTLLLYAGLSVKFPMNGGNNTLQTAIGSHFNLSLIVLLPVIVLFIMLVWKKQIIPALISSMLMAILVAVFVQGETFAGLWQTAVYGFQLPADNPLADSLKTTGVLGMLKAILTVMASALYSGIFSSTDLLKPIQTPLLKLCNHTSNAFGLLVSSLIGSAIGCSQTFAILFANQLIGSRYAANHDHQNQLANDMANTGVLMPALIPWNAACSIPASLLGTGFAFIPFAFFLFIAPVEMLLKASLCPNQLSETNMIK